MAKVKKSVVKESIKDMLIEWALKDDDDPQRIDMPHVSGKTAVKKGHTLRTMVKSKKSRGYRDSSRVRKHHKLFADFRFELAFLFRMNSFAMDKENNHKRAYGFARNAMVQYKLAWIWPVRTRKRALNHSKLNLLS